jgi:hypothetical protein
MTLLPDQLGNSGAGYAQAASVVPPSRRTSPRRAHQDGRGGPAP